MAITKDEIDKYIFDPENPKQCKSYNLLLKIAKKGSYTYISKDFFSHFFISSDIVNQLEKELWDIPTNYKELSKNEKIELYIKQFSFNEFFELLNKISISNSIFKKIFFYIFSEYKNPSYMREMDWLSPEDMGLDYFPPSHLKSIESKIIDLEQNFSELFSTYEDYTSKIYPYSKNKWNNLEDENKILLYNFDTTNILDVEEFFQRSTVLVTTLEHEKKFFGRNISDNIKPIFLKKIEDVDILLNVLEQDLQQKNQKNLPQEKVSTISEISIKNFFSIKDIELDNLKDKKEIYVVGENGDGKSLFLQAIVVALAGVKEGDVFDLVKSQPSYALSVKDSEDEEYTQTSNKSYNNIMAYGAARNNYCQMKEDTSGYLTLFQGEYDLKSPIKWLQYLDYSEQSDKKNVITVVEAKNLLQELLNSDIEINITPDEVKFIEKGSEVSFDQLSAGYKGVITIICDLIARLSEKQQVEHIADFQGVVLIDEVELHLHPKWQYSFMNKLRETFPLIQFIVTTHSPTVLLGAGMEAVYYQIYKDGGAVKISEQKDVKNDFLNDIQTNIFGFDVNDERIHNPSKDDKKRQKRAKEAMLGLIETIEKE